MALALQVETDADEMWERKEVEDDEAGCTERARQFAHW